MARGAKRSGSGSGKDNGSAKTAMKVKKPRQTRSTSKFKESVTDENLRPSKFDKNSSPSSSTSDSRSRERELDILRQFDLNYTFGPAVGLTRKERLERALAFHIGNSNSKDWKELQDVKNILEKHRNEPEFSQCIWSGRCF